MGALAVFTLRRRVRRLAIRLEVEAFGHQQHFENQNLAEGSLFIHAGEAEAKRDAAARIREVLDDAEQ